MLAGWFSESPLKKTEPQVHFFCVRPPLLDAVIDEDDGEDEDEDEH